MNDDRTDATEDADASADGTTSGDCDCEFCSPEPEIMPLPRSGAARNSVQQPIGAAGDAVGGLLT